MTHHVMNQMGHEFPNMIGVKTGDLDKQVRSLLPNYMSMGSEGMGDMAEMGMPVPPNSIPMVGAAGPHDYITMGGMFTILKVREGLKSYDEDPGWYQDKPGELASLAPADVLKQNGIAGDGSTAPISPFPALVPTHAVKSQSGHSSEGGGHGGHQMKSADTGATPAPAGVQYTCTMHPEVIADKPGKCPKCGMKLVSKKK
jgi:hypothetical protein